MEFYPSVNNFTLAPLVLLVTNITSALGYYFMCFRSVFSRSYVVILVTIGYFFPLSIIAFSYFGIIRYIIGISRHFPTKSQYFSFFKRTNKETVDIFKRVNISNYMQKPCNWKLMTNHNLKQMRSDDKS